MLDICAGLLERSPIATSSFCDEIINETIEELEEYESKHLFMEMDRIRDAQRDVHIKHFI